MLALTDTRTPEPASATAPVVAVMQPYLFPYLGYFSLVAACNHFVFYDDVAHMPRGWIHRNRILVNGAPYTFTLPLAHSSQNRLIAEVHTHDLAGFRRRFVRQLEGAYRRAPQFEPTLALVLEVLGDADSPGDGEQPVAELAMRSVQAVCAAIGLEPRFLRSSQSFAALRGAERAERLIRITRALGANRYVNAPGGTALYSPAAFAAQGVSLQFVQPRLEPYPQRGGGGFVPGLSVIDALMQLPRPEVLRLVQAYTLQ